jgi:NADP-dependent 3-hydroxy acid dehydrogenase YdfG
MQLLQNRVYIVTGASKGFGFAISKKLLAAGAKVGLIARGQQGLDKALAELDAGTNAFAVAASVDQREDIFTAINSIVAHFGKLDGIINNAGIARPAPIASVTEEELSSQLAINVNGTVFGCQAAIPHLTGDNPRIINISSATAFHSDEMAHLAIYGASKAAVERLSRDLRIELAPNGIAITVIRPGSAATDFATAFDGDKLMDALKAWADTGKYMYTGMEVEQVADAVAWALAMPKGVAVDLLEIRPNTPQEKITF